MRLTAVAVPLSPVILQKAGQRGKHVLAVIRLAAWMSPGNISEAQPAHVAWLRYRHERGLAPYRRDPGTPGAPITAPAT